MSSVPVIPQARGLRHTGPVTVAVVSGPTAGREIQVPLFITTGEKVKVDTRSGDYLGRISEK